MTKPTKRTVKAWAIKTPKGRYYVNSDISTRRETIKAAERKLLLLGSWSGLQKAGYRCVPVIIMEVK